MLELLLVSQTIPTVEDTQLSSLQQVIAQHRIYMHWIITFLSAYGIISYIRIIQIQLPKTKNDLVGKRKENDNTCACICFTELLSMSKFTF